MSVQNSARLAPREFQESMVFQDLLDHQVMLAFQVLEFQESME